MTFGTFEDAHYDSIKEIARQAGEVRESEDCKDCCTSKTEFLRREDEVREPEGCIGCPFVPTNDDLAQKLYLRHAILCCSDNSEPNPDFEITRRAWWIKESMNVILRADSARRKLGASINSPTFQEQIKDARSSFRDNSQKLLDATNSAVAKPEKSEG